MGEFYNHIEKEPVKYIRSNFCFITNVIFILRYDTLLHFTTLLYFTLLYCSLLFSTIPYFTLLYNTILKNRKIQYNSEQYSTVQYIKVQNSTVQYSTVQYSTVQYIMVQNRTVWTITTAISIFLHISHNFTTISLPNIKGDTATLIWLTAFSKAAAAADPEPCAGLIPWWSTAQHAFCSFLFFGWIWYWPKYNVKNKKEEKEGKWK